MNIKTVGVVGSGTMGSGIALVCARAGYETIVFDRNQLALDRAFEQARKFLEKSVSRKKLNQNSADEILSCWKGVTEIKNLAECDVIIEAVFEDLSVKHELFSELNSICPDHTLFVSNTSTLSITEIAGGSGRDDRFIGMHFCLPAQLMKLVEVSPGLNTLPDNLACIWQFCVDLGQNPVKTKDTPGFVLNYFLVPYHNDAIRMVEKGIAEPGDIDKAIKTAMGYKMGPMELLDLVGLDTQKLLCDALYGATYEPRAACPSLVKRMIAAGHLGKKVGKGLLNYDNNNMFGA
jgi:3-hydroxybutyryl-CoA dehydrogenase|tara:strand:- start:20068 stop:20940 length:873 start_codon:yes stop_codon:yes gene_type:complete